MSHELICSCLQLPPDSWPPDHYKLLGLEPGELDAQRIEQCVQERMEKLRPYQLTHAEQATEAMNRLAQALVCLTDPVARKAYDAKLSPRAARRPSGSAVSRRASLTELERAPTQPSRATSHWLLFAWILWLFVGIVGLATVGVYFPTIQASYYGELRKLEPAKKAAPKNPPFRSSERPAPSIRE